MRIQVTLHELKKHGSDRMLFDEVPPGYGVIDMGDDRKLRRIFSDIRSGYPSQRFLLFTWDHGSGFGIFKTNPAERSLLEKEAFLNFEMEVMQEGNSRSPVIPEAAIEFDIIDNHSTEEEPGSPVQGKKGEAGKKIKTSMLTNDELRNTILYDTQARKVDLLIMMNCAMQMIETGYALQDAVEYLVAPETCIFWAGYDYKSIISKLCIAPDIETEALGKYAIDTIESYYKNTPSRTYFNDLVVSLVKPAASVEIRTAIDEIADQLTNKLGQSFAKIKSLRTASEDLTQKYVSGVPYHYIDFLGFVAALAQTADMITLERIKQATEKYVIHIIKGNNYSQVDTANNIGRVNGYTIYFPPTAYEADDDVYYDWFYKAGNRQTLFAGHCTWKVFLQQYFRYSR
ncbi:MAG: hypothetical protein INR73_03075 [Williamsia sp.]|nr:hypothetical protein [Williamsia sp.]